MITYFNKDLTPILEQGDFQIFAHGCNCFRTMGAGIAKQVKRIFPSVYKADCETIKGDRAKLGSCGFISVGDNKFVVNAYTQFGIWDKVNVDYDAVTSCFTAINEFMLDNKLNTLTIPKIGAGLAGGDWDKIKEIIEREMDGDFTINVFYL